MEFRTAFTYVTQMYVSRGCKVIKLCVVEQLKFFFFHFEHIFHMAYHYESGELSALCYESEISEDEHS
jgi:hypothetical protein